MAIDLHWVDTCRCFGVNFFSLDEYLVRLLYCTTNQVYFCVYTLSALYDYEPVNRWE